MNIGQAAKASGVPAKMIRYYEAIGLVPDPRPLKNEYRDYDATDVHRLRFCALRRDVGLPIESVGDLLRLWSDRKRSRSQVKAATLACIAELEERAADLADMIKTMRRVAQASERSGGNRGPPSDRAKPVGRQ